MQQHSQIGYDILSKSDAPLLKLAAEIALHHHEKWDGSGYPSGLAGINIPASARIVAIADVFDALTMCRPYKKAWPVSEAMQLISDGAGQHFDPELAACFLEIRPHILDIKHGWDQQEAEQSPPV